MEKLDQSFFYLLEKTVKAYRQFAQTNFKEAGVDITIDQWLILKTIQDNENISQKELAEIVFKDKASITRIIELLEKDNFIKRVIDKTNRKKNIVTITPKGAAIVRKLIPIVLNNRKIALNGATPTLLNPAVQVLNLICVNCEK